MSNVSDQVGPDKELPDEQQLDEYLRGGSAVSRQYRQLPSADVPVELDHLVLRQAQEAVKLRPAKSRTWVRWTGPLALAASAVLVVSIVIESGVHEDTYLTVPASAPAEVTTKQEAAERLSADHSAETKEARDSAVAGNAEDASVVHIMPPPVADIRPPAFVPEVPAPSEDQASVVRPAPPPMPAPRAQQFSSPAPEAPTEQPLAAQSSAELADRPPSDAISETVVTARRAATPAQASASTPVSVIDDDDISQVVVTGMHRSQQKQTAGPRNTVVPDSGSNADEEEADEPSDYSDPEEWLRDIRELREENNHRLANREWRRFRRAFPNYEVAEDDPARGSRR